MQDLKTALKEAARVFVPSRLMIMLLSYIGVVQFALRGQSSSLCMTRNIRDCFLAWYHFDAMAYIRIAVHGYSLSLDTAFFPLWPMLIRVGGQALGSKEPGSYYLAALLLSNIFFFLALALLYLLLSRQFEPAIARRTLFYLTFYVYALFFFAGYTESLFLFLCLAFLLVLQRGSMWSWWLAGALGFLAILTRSTGVVLGLPYLLFYIQRLWLSEERDRHTWFQRIHAFVPILLIPAGLLLYMAYLGITKGDPLIFSRKEALYWGRVLEPPWIPFGQTIGVFFTQPPNSLTFVQNLLDLTFTLLPVAILIIGWKQIPLQYSLFALGLMILSISFPLARDEALASQPRYMMMMFPIFIIMAAWSKKYPWFERWFVALSIPLLALNCLLFVTHHWVA